MGRPSRKTFFQLCLLMLVLNSTAYAGEKTEGAVAYHELESSPYRFAERLATDGASLFVFPEAYTKIGVWAEDRFIFPGSSGDADVLVGGDKIDDKPLQIIQLQLHSNTIRTLKFSQIEAKPRLVLQFKAPPNELGNSSLSSIYIRVYIGKRLLDRLRIATDSEWIRKEYQLSNAQFLKQKLTLTLSMTCDAEESMLMILGYLKN